MSPPKKFIASSLEKKGYLFISFFFIFSLFLIFPQNTAHQKQLQPIREKLKNIPKEEKKLLLKPLKQAVLRSSFGYTFLGEKPLSFDGYFDQSSIDASFKNPKLKKIALRESEKLQKGWDVWEKYASLFLSENYLLKKHAEKKIPGSIIIFFVNKRAFLNKIEENYQDFEKVLGKNISAKEILLSLEQGEGIFYDAVMGHDGLFGILLGFGKNNSWNFHRRNLLKQQIQTSSQEVNMLEHELYLLNKNLTFFNVDKGLFLKPIFLPMFIADLKSEETQDLKIRYKQCRKRLKKIYRNGDFLENSLLQLAQD